MPTTTPDLRLGTPAGRWVIATSVVGSGMAFLDGSVVNAALPAIAGDLDADLAALQWIVTGYLLSLSAFLIIGGALGDRHGHRTTFLWGTTGFVATSALCGLALGPEQLVAARLAQGMASALLVPASLALVSASFHPEDRAAAIGTWSGLSGVAAAVGPFLGGWLIDAVSWRAVFALNLPLGAVAVATARWRVPDVRTPAVAGPIDLAGGGLLAAALAGGTFALIQGPATGWDRPAVVAGVVGLLATAAFLVVEARVAHPMVPLRLFADPQFGGANLSTLFVYGALGSLTFFVVVHLQSALGYSALEAGASLLPLTLLLLAFSGRSGALAQRIGPRFQMTTGPVVLATGVALFTRAQPGRSFWVGVLPGSVVAGIGLTILVAPLTATVLAAVADRQAGVASAVNNAVARLGSLLAVAVLPGVVGLTAGEATLDLGDGYARALWITAALALVGGAVAAATIRTVVPVEAAQRRAAG